MGLYEAKGLLDELMLERQVFRDARAGVCERPLQAYLVNLSSESFYAHVDLEGLGREVQLTRQTSHPLDAMRKSPSSRARRIWSERISSCRVS